MAFDRNVFINCPFDDDYRGLLEAIVFTLMTLGFEPRIASESLDSGRPRIAKLIGMVAESKYAIHDLSRLKSKEANEFFRLNMPFELGLDVGCREFKGGKWTEKRCLILETEPHRFKAAISDLSNSDIGVHGGSAEGAMREVRNWLVQQERIKAPGPAKLLTEFLVFLGENDDYLEAEGYSRADINALPMHEYMECIRRWRSAKDSPAP